MSSDSVEVDDTGLDTRVRIGNPPKSYGAGYLFQGFYFGAGSTVYSWRPESGYRLEVVVARNSEAGRELAAFVEDLTKQEALTYHDRGTCIEAYMYRLAFKRMGLDDILMLFGRTQSHAYDEGFKACKAQLRRFILGDSVGPLYDTNP